jgi:hypothetical protein
VTGGQRSIFKKQEKWQRDFMLLAVEQGNWKLLKKWESGQGSFLE